MSWWMWLLLWTGLVLVAAVFLAALLWFAWRLWAASSRPLPPAASGSRGSALSRARNP